MAIREVTMHQGVCDGCGKTMADMGSDYWAWTDESSVLEDMANSDWQTPGEPYGGVSVAGPHLCPNCVPADDDEDVPTEEATDGE